MYAKHKTSTLVGRYREGMGQMYFILIKKILKTDVRRRLQNKTKLSMYSSGAQIEIDERKIEICQLNFGGYTLIEEKSVYWNVVVE